MSQRKLWLRRVERALLMVGLILLTAQSVARVHGQIYAHLALREFEAAQAPTNSEGQSTSLKRVVDADVSLWSPQRILHYMESVAGREPPLAVLRIPKLRLEVPVFDGTDELTLNRGAGRIIGTAKLGDIGNTGIAGHRDGFFRGLKDVRRGDILELMTPGRRKRYVVTDVQITVPEDVSVLRPTAHASLTLVTCYPFYFVGSAPQRYIVHASVDDADSSDETFLLSSDSLAIR